MDEENKENAEVVSEQEQGTVAEPTTGSESIPVTDSEGAGVASEGDAII